MSEGRGMNEFPQPVDKTDAHNICWRRTHTQVQKQISEKTNLRSSDIM